MVIQLSCVLVHVRFEKEALEVLIEPVEKADNILLEMQTLEKQIEGFEYSLDAQGQDVKSMDEIQEQLMDKQNRKYAILIISAYCK